MSRTFVISAFGLNDQVMDCQNGNCFKTGLILSSVIAKNNKLLISGSRAISDRSCSGFSQYQDQRIESSFDLLEKIPVSILWHGLVNHKDNSKLFREVEHYVTYDPTEKNVAKKNIKENLSVYKLIASHIESLFCDFSREFKEDLVFKKSDIKLVVPIPNELSEYAQEDLLKSFGKSRDDIVFIWREIAALIQYLNLHYEECVDYINKKIKVFYAGIDGFEYALFKLKKEGEFIVPVRERPKKNTTKLSGVNFICNCFKNYIKTNSPSIKNTSNEEKLIWQFLTTRSDVVESILNGLSKECLLPVSVPNIHLVKNVNILNKDVLISLLSTAESSLYSKLSLEKNSNQNKDVSILDLLIDDNEESSAILLCGDLASELMVQNFQKLLANKSPIKILHDKSNLILDGCKLYADRLSQNSPTYFDTLPLLEIAYYDKLEQECEWFPLVSEDLIAGGKTYYLKEPCTKFSLGKGAKILQLYLRTESFKSDDDGIQFAEKIFPQKAPQDLHLSISVEMKAAFGLAKIIIKDTSNYFPSHGYIFDYSEMKKAKLPDFSGSLAYPPEEKYQIYNKKTDKIYLDILDKDLDYIVRKINLYCNYSNLEFELSQEQIENLFVDIRDNLCFKMFDLNLKCINYEYEFCLKTILQAAEEIAKKFLKNQKHIMAMCKFTGVMTYLYKGTPKSIQDFYRNLLMTDHNISAQKYFYSACRCLYGSNTDIRSIYNKYNSLIDRNKMYLHQAMFFLLNYVKVAKYCFDEKTALNMVEACIASLNELRKSRSYKLKFIWAIRLFLMSLKYRCIDENFLASDKYDSYIRRLDFVINEAVNYYSRYAINSRYCDNIMKIGKQIQAYLNKEGSADILNALKLIEEENSVK